MAQPGPATDFATYTLLEAPPPNVSIAHALVTRRKPQATPSVTSKSLVKWWTLLLRVLREWARLSLLVPVSGAISSVWAQRKAAGPSVPRSSGLTHGLAGLY
ncbi:uncharacterized protein FIBRA_08746 [Fibroporia radiculosa]|uniref:Uncharacterized protein n=1 Tax=Fibroporia radiculosa TaxID=599839 RepID=J4I395_9APHY|nr:uncharacterized protein FIBRA_08746 [Fibroporia radiculosa]CCM06477.1 predicted protein [Fibroporia radiculosa]